MHFLCQVAPPADQEQYAPLRLCSQQYGILLRVTCRILGEVAVMFGHVSEERKSSASKCKCCLFICLPCFLSECLN